MHDYLTFEKMIAPILIQVIFWIGVVVVVLSGIVTLFSAGVQGVIAGLLIIIVGPLVVRIYCELLIVLFRIYDHVREIRDNTAKG